MACFRDACTEDRAGTRRMSGSSARDERKGRDEGLGHGWSKEEIIFVRVVRTWIVRGRGMVAEEGDRGIK